MEAFTAVIDLLQKGVTGLGVGLAIGGVIVFASAQADNNAAEKQKGINLFIAAGICIMGAILVVPMLSTVFS